MNYQLAHAKKTMLILAIVLLVAATALLILQFFFNGKPEGYVDGMGIIDHIDWEPSVVDQPGGINHYFVKYTYNGVEYINELHNYSGTFQVGDKIELLININDPNVIRNLGTSQGNMNYLIGCIILYGLGALCLVIFFLVSYFDKRAIREAAQ